MEIKDLTVEMVTPVLEALVAEFGEGYVYKEEVRKAGRDAECLYQEDGKPSCIVGHVLYRLGVKYDSEWEYWGARRVLGDAPEEVKEGLSRAQGYQDCGKTWGEALSSYRRYLKSCYV